MGVVVTVDRGEGEALIVFRDAKEAQRFQEHTAVEGFELVCMSLEELRALIDRYDFGWVAVPKPWAGESIVVDLFTAESFIRKLDESSEE